MIVEIEREDDGRWIAEIPDIPGVMTYGPTREEALAKVKALALRVLADRLEHGEQIPELGKLFAVPENLGTENLGTPYRFRGKPVWCPRVFP